jgi:hypothetical protein
MDAKAAAAAKAPPVVETYSATVTIGPERYATPPKDGRVYKKICNGGKCHWELASP